MAFQEERGTFRQSVIAHFMKIGATCDGVQTTDWFESNRNMQSANAALLAAFSIGGVADARTLPKEGRFDFTSCGPVSNDICFSKTHT
jgi:hypothetical protein